jgi:hypothetical protein
MPRKDQTSPAVFENLPAGDYRIRAVLRPCDGNCDFLDAPVSPCHKTVHVVGNASFVVHWRVGEDCTITRS